MNSDAADKARKLLAKAESTTFPAEARLLRDKAKELQAKYGVTADKPRKPTYQQAWSGYTNQPPAGNDGSIFKGGGGLW